MNKKSIPNQEMSDLLVEQLNNQKEVSFTVTGTSMRPFFKDRLTKVTVKQYDTYQKYDVVLFQFQSQILLHRIIKIADNRVYLQGDGAFRIEEINQEQIYGKVIYFSTKGKTSKHYLFKVKVWIFFKFMRKLLLKVL